LWTSAASRATAVATIQLSQTERACMALTSMAFSRIAGVTSALVAGGRSRYFENPSEA
jgi:hypothetical protein